MALKGTAAAPTQACINCLLLPLLHTRSVNQGKGYYCTPSELFIATPHASQPPAASTHHKRALAAAVGAGLRLHLSAFRVLRANEQSGSQ